MATATELYKKTSRLVIAFGVLAVVTNLISVLFFSFDELAADGVTYVKDYSPLWQSLLYLALCGVGAYFIGRESKVAAIIAGLFATLVAFSTFLFSIYDDGANLMDAIATSHGGYDMFVVMYLFYFVVSLLSITLCAMITGVSFKAVSMGK
jgi:hypothetical protein